MKTVERFECGGKATSRRLTRHARDASVSSESKTTRDTGDDKAQTHASTTVDLLRAESDGAAALLDAARRWGKPAGPLGVVAGDPETGETSVAQLEAWMAANGSLLPVVEVTVVFGKHFHLAGYPPWQLHKAEDVPPAEPVDVLADQVRGRAARVRGGLEKTREVKSEFVKSCGESTVVTYVPGTHRTITRHGVDGRRDGRFVTRRETRENQSPCVSSRTTIITVPLARLPFRLCPRLAPRLCRPSSGRRA